MKRLVLSLALALPGTSFAIFMDGQELYKLLEAGASIKADRFDPLGASDGAYGLGYVIGVTDASDGQLFCMPPSVKIGQVEAMTMKYLKENPDKWNRPANLLVVEALKPTFPCPKN